MAQDFSLVREADPKAQPELATQGTLVPPPGLCRGHPGVFIFSFYHLQTQKEPRLTRVQI